MSQASAEARFATLVAQVRDEPGVHPPAGGAGFGADALKVDGRIFAMLSQGTLVVKLPRERVDELVAEGAGHHFDPGHGRVMHGWLALDSSAADRWEELGRDALVAGRESRRG